MPAAPYWQDDPESWDRVSLGGQLMPGLAKVTGSIARKLDIKSVRGRDGARVRDGGYEPAKISIELRINNRDDFQALQARLDAINPRQRGTARTAVDIAHPSLTFLGIASVYIEKVSAPEVSGDTLTVKIEAVEWTQAPRSRPRGSGTNSAGPANPDTVEQREARARRRAVPTGGP